MNIFPTCKLSVTEKKNDSLLMKQRLCLDVVERSVVMDATATAVLGNLHASGQRKSLTDVFIKIADRSLMLERL